MFFLLLVFAFVLVFDLVVFDLVVFLVAFFLVFFSAINVEKQEVALFIKIMKNKHLNIKVPGARFERATARSSAECSPRLSYPGTLKILFEVKLKFVFLAFPENIGFPFPFVNCSSKNKQKIG